MTPIGEQDVKEESREYTKPAESLRSKADVLCALKQMLSEAGYDFNSEWDQICSLRTTYQLWVNEMHKSTSKFQLSQPARQFFADHSVYWANEEAELASSGSAKSPLSRLRDGTKRIGIEHYLRNKIHDHEISALLFQLVDMNCGDHISPALLQILDKRILELGEAFKLLEDEKNEIIRFVCNSISRLDARPTRYLIVNSRLNP